MVIDRECWGFVAALIANMESAALGSFLYFSNSLHPLPFYCTLRPPLSVSSVPWDIISIYLFVYFHFFLFASPSL